MALRSNIVGALLAAALILTGCGQSGEPAVETLQGGVGTELPAGFPSSIPQPPGGQLMAAFETPDGLSVMWTVEGLTPESFDTYVASVKSAGFNSEISATDMDMGDEGFTKVVVLVGGSQTISITGFLVGGSGQVSMVVAAE